MKRLLVVIVLVCGLGWPTLKAQDYLYEVGLGMGLSSAYGDINSGRLFYKPGFQMNGHFRYQYNLRWSFVGEFSTAGLRGDSKDFDNVFPDNAHLYFRSRLWQLVGRTEFNFFNYGIGPSYKDIKAFTPFISLGVGLGAVSGDGNGQFSFSIPIGVGLKYRLTQRWGLDVRLDFAKMFTDNSDGVNDPYGIVSNSAKNTDWYSTLQIGVSYQFGRRKVDCISR